jgi:2-methylcitrate dehydratase PrpD
LDQTCPSRLAAQSGLRAALLDGKVSPARARSWRSNTDFFAFADPSITPDYTRLIDGLGAHWQAANIAFKPYACGTMAQPFIDCAIRLAKDGVKPADIAAITCKAGEGTVHRLWEKLAEKRAPTTPYSA